MRNIYWIAGLGLLGMGHLSLAAEHGNRGQQALENLDTNGDGVVDFVEFQENAPDVIAGLDTDGDDAVSLDEFLNGRTGRPGRRGGGRLQGAGDEELAEIRETMLERATERFTAMDLDGDNLVSRGEMQEAAFLQMDGDSNGVLSAAELRRRGPDGPGRRGSGRRGGPGGVRGAQSTDN